MDKKQNIEKELLGEEGLNLYETEFENKLEEEIQQARKEMEKKNKKDVNIVKITDISKLSPEEKFDKNSIYRVFNRKQKTETFVNGEQAENMLKYTDDYIIRFDHRIVEVDN